LCLGWTDCITSERRTSSGGHWDRSWRALLGQFARWDLGIGNQDVNSFPFLALRQHWPYFSHTSAVSKWKRPPKALSSQALDHPTSGGPGMCRRPSHVRTLEKTAYMTRTGSRAHAHAHARVRVMCERSMLSRRGGCRRKDRELGDGEKRGQW